MENKNGFTLIELLAVIVVLAIVMVLAVTTVLPLMDQSKEQAFRVEATNTVKQAKSALELYKLQQLTVSDSTSSCRSTDGKTMCFTVAELVNKELYDIDPEVFSGKVVITKADESHPVYTLYFKKGAEYVLSGETFEDYSKKGTIKAASTWETANESCSCS